MRLSRTRAAALGTVTALLAFTAAELLAYAAIAILERRLTGTAELNARQEARTRGIRTRFDREVRYRARHGGEVVHPYLGYVTARWESEEEPRAGTEQVESMVHRRSPDLLLVGVAGGSVALGLAHHAEAVLAPHLAATPEFAGREMVLVTLAKAGWKQPQQLMALSYLLALGGELDVLINLDGFNEVALHGAENQARGVFPAYPRNWEMRVRALPDPAVLPLVGRTANLEAARKRWARELRRPPWGWSALTGFAWLAGDRWHAARIYAAQRRVLKHEPGNRSYEWTGPQVAFESEQALYEELVAIWSRTSTQLHRLSEANGILYLHLLQPNQYVAGSKPMGPEERRVALTDIAFRHGAEYGYPMLIRERRELAGRGVPCHDLTQLFAEVTEPLYTDACCHFGEEGYKLLGAYAVRALQDSRGVDLGRVAPAQGRFP